MRDEAKRKSVGVKAMDHLKALSLIKESTILKGSETS